jgi:hypothetical protein
MKINDILNEMGSQGVDPNRPPTGGAGRSRYNQAPAAKPGNVAQPATPANVPPRPTGMSATYTARTAWDKNYAGKYDPKTGAPIGASAASPAATSQTSPLSSQAQAALSGQVPAGQAAQPNKATKKPAPDPAVLARQQELIAAGAKIKADGIMGDKTRAAEKKFGANIDTAKAGNQTTSAYAPTTPNPNVASTPTAADTAQASTAVDPSIGAGQNLAYLGQQQKQQDAMTDFQKLAGIAPSVSPSGQAAQPTTGQLPPGLAGATTSQGSAEQPAGQAAQPQANPDGTGAGVNPDTGLSSTPKPVKGGFGQSTNVTTGSDDEMAWRQKNPQWSMTGQQYPGPGAWDPNTGRSKKDIEQGAKNLQGIKNFFGFGKKDAGPTGNVNNQTSGYNRPQQESADLAMLRKLSGLR